MRKPSVDGARPYPIGPMRFTRWRMLRALITAAHGFCLLLGISRGSAGGRSSAAVIGPMQTFTGGTRSLEMADLLALRQIQAVQLSPNGKEVAVITLQARPAANRTEAELHVVAVDGAHPVRAMGDLGPIRYQGHGDPLPTGPRWSPDGRYILMTMSDGKHHQVWRFEAETGQRLQLTNEADDVVGYECEQADEVVYTVSRSSLQPAERAAFEDRVYRRGIPLKYYVRPPYTGRAAVSDYVRREFPNELRARRVPLAGGPARDLSPEEFRARGSIWPGNAMLAFDAFKANETLQQRTAKLSPDHHWTVMEQIVGDLGQSTSRYGLFLRENGKQEAVQCIDQVYPYIGAILGWSADSRTVTFVASDGEGGRRIYRADLASHRATEIYKVATAINDVTLNGEGKFAVGLQATTARPNHIVLIDLEKGDLRELWDPNPEFAAVRLPAHRRIDWINRYGDQGYAILVYPQDFDPARTYPLVVTTYRAGGFLQGATGDEYPIYLFARHGIAVLAFDIGRGLVTFPDEDGGRDRSPADGLRVTLEALASLVKIDPNRRGICGLSHGSDFAAEMTAFADLFAAAILSSGSPDIASLYLRGVSVTSLAKQTWGQDVKSMSYGDPVVDKLAVWEKLSPALNVKSIRSAVLVNAADTEMTNSLNLVTAMRERNLPVDLYSFPDELHVKTQPAHRAAIYERNLDWFRFWLQDYEDPAAEKQSQYQEWRKLRSQRQQALSLPRDPSRDWIKSPSYPQ